MNTTMRNLTLTAAALAALMVTAPKAAADDRGRNQNRRESPRQEYREHEGHEHGYGYGRGSYGRAYVAPRPVARYGHGYAAPFRIFSGVRFYSAYPGPNYVYIANYGWVVPPFFGAVWVPAHYDVEGYWVEGFWR